MCYFDLKMKIKITLLSLFYKYTSCVLIALVVVLLKFMLKVVYWHSHRKLMRASNAHDMNNINTSNIDVSYLFHTLHKYQLYTCITAGIMKHCHKV